MTKMTANTPDRLTAPPPDEAVARQNAGVLPIQDIETLIARRQVILAEPACPAQIQPASLDLRLGHTAYRVRASFLPGPEADVATRLSTFSMHEIDLSDGAVLETGCVYVVPLLESLDLPEEVFAAANPKSSTGRLDVFTRIIADRVQAFDQVGGGYSGPLYAEICPQTFPIVVRKGSRLSQIRFRRGEAAVSSHGLAELQASDQLVSGGATDIADGGIALSVDLTGDEKGLVGYRAKRHSGLVDVDRVGACPVSDFWEAIHVAPGARRLILDPDEFYILASKEAVHVPPTHAAEMMPFNPLVGEFRVHYAGFMDPGFGHAPAGGGGARVVLEVRSHKVPFILEDGQIVGRLVYERLTERPRVLYGRDLGSNYQAQGLKLSKHFG